MLSDGDQFIVEFFHVKFYKWNNIWKSYPRRNFSWVHAYGAFSKLPLLKLYSEQIFKNFIGINPSENE